MMIRIYWPHGEFTGTQEFAGPFKVDYTNGYIRLEPNEDEKRALAVIPFTSLLYFEVVDNDCGTKVPAEPPPPDPFVSAAASHDGHVEPWPTFTNMPPPLPRIGDRELHVADT